MTASRRYVEHPPAPALREHVACYWTLTGEAPRVHRVLPDGCMDLLFDLVAGSAVIVGVMTRAIVVPPAGRVALLGVRFRPGEATAFLRFAAREAKDRVVPYVDGWRAPREPLADRLASLPDTPARIRALDAALLEARLSARFAEPRVRAAVRALEASAGAVAVSALAERSGLGERQLERAFHERVGVGPKALARALRLQAFVAALARAPRRSLAAVAAEVGFADQPHLVREVRALAGVTPGELARERMSDSSNPAIAPTGTIAAS